MALYFSTSGSSGGGGGAGARLGGGGGAGGAREPPGGAWLEDATDTGALGTAAGVDLPGSGREAGLGREADGYQKGTKSVDGRLS